MKYVQKRGAPQAYRAWCRKVQGTWEEHYGELRGDLKSLVLVGLIKEQGDICAYTMKRIDIFSSHIEHIKPETLCRAEEAGSDLEYSNMVACFPRTGMAHRCRYGAQKKADWWFPALFVSPLNPSCEKRFRFGRDGAISAVRNTAAAINTIRVLGLDNASLTEDRRRAIDELIYGPGGNYPLSRAEALRLQGQVCDRSAGGFVEFCIAF